MHKVSIISIALSAVEFIPLEEALSKQTFKDYEFIGEVGGSIPEAWNRAVERARGEILVFTETDATPVNEYWLEELVSSIPDEKTIVKGLEFIGAPWDLANLACYRSALNGTRFDERFRWAEDTELFCRLKANGYQFLQLKKAPVIHQQKMGSKRMIRRAFRYGLYNSRLNHRYEDPVELGTPNHYLKLMFMSFMNLLGYLLGWLFYWPERRNRSHVGKS